jgi:hypothetical protein
MKARPQIPAGTKLRRRRSRIRAFWIVPIAVVGFWVFVWLASQTLIPKDNGSPPVVHTISDTP